MKLIERLCKESKKTTSIVAVKNKLLIVFTQTGNFKDDDNTCLISIARDIVYMYMSKYICYNNVNKTLGSCKWHCNYGQEVKPEMATQIVQHSLIKIPAACFVFTKYVFVVYR